MTLRDDESLLQYVWWPKNPRKSAGEVRAILDRVQRFVDFDGTIVGDGMVPRGKILGRPLAEFLAEQAYVIQTWNPDGARKFFGEMFPEFSQPELILVPESLVEGDAMPDFVGKNFAALGVTDKIIIDDALDCEIYAPGCAVLKP
jgi:hypothetical protein